MLELFSTPFKLSTRAVLFFDFLPRDRGKFLDKSEVMPDESARYVSAAVPGGVRESSGAMT